MSRVSTAATPKDDVITIKGSDLPLHCPGPQSPLWSMHPRIYIDISKEGSAACPYCGAKYRLEEGAKAPGH